MNPLVQVPAVPETNAKGLAAIEQARAFTITNQEEAAVVDAFCVNLKALEKEVGLAYDEHIEAAFKAHKALVAKKKVYAEPIEEARRIAKGKLIAWSEAERVRLEREAEIARAEALKKAEDEALARAERAAEFDEKAADAIISAPVVVEPIKAAAPAKTATVFQTRWKFRINNPALIPREYLIPDETKIGGVIRATKGSISIPGVEAFSERV